MNNATLQSLIARNAVVIANLDIQIGHGQDKAVHLKSTGEIAFSIDQYKKVARLKAKRLAAHAIQNDLYAELASNQLRAQSISRLIAMGHGKLVPATLTSIELANLADALAEAVPKTEPLPKAA